MAKQVRIVLNKRNIGAFLRSSDVAGVLEGPANRIAARADSGIPGGKTADTFHKVAIVQGRKDRVIALITAEGYEARKAESDDRNLTKALDAGRG